MAAMKPDDTYGIRKWEFLDIVWEVEEVQSKTSICCKGLFLFRADWRKITTK